MKKPQAVREFLGLVESACPLAELAVDHADKPDGDWWIDARANGELITVFWSPKSGFGFSTQDPIGYGEKPNEVYASAAMAATRFVQLMQRAGTGRTRSLGIAELRELFGLSQTELAERVGVEQAAISRVEGRENLELNTLRSLVEAMGLRLSVQVVAPGISANIEPGKAKEKSARVAKAVRRKGELGRAPKAAKKTLLKGFVFKPPVKVRMDFEAPRTRRSVSAAPGKSQRVTK